MSTKTSEYDIIIHTDNYSGNFEREFRAYVTGFGGENDLDRGHDFAGDIREAFGVERDGDWSEAEENPFLDLFRYVRGEWGSRIEEITHTPSEYVPSGVRGGCNSIILHLDRKPTKKQLATIKEWSMKFAAKSQEPRAKNDYDHPWRFINPVRVLACVLHAKRIKTVHTRTEF